MQKVFLYSIFLILVFVFGCSKYVVRTGYRNLDWLAIYQIDSYFDLSSAQESYLKKEFAEILRWHKEKELPVYRSYIEKIELLVAQEEIDREELQKNFREVFALRKRYVEKMKPIIVNFLLTVQPEQIKYLRKRFAEYNSSKNEDDGLELSEIQFYEKMSDKKIKTIEKYVGSLREEQVQLVKDQGIVSQKYMRIRNRQRQIYQENFLKFLESDFDRFAVETTVIDWLKIPENYQLPEYNEAQKQRNEINIKLMIQIHKSLDEEQKKRLLEQFDIYSSYIDIMES